MHEWVANCHYRICVGAIANSRPKGPGMLPITWLKAWVQLGLGPHVEKKNFYSVKCNVKIESEIKDFVFERV